MCEACGFASVRTADLDAQKVRQKILNCAGSTARWSSGAVWNQARKTKLIPTIDIGRKPAGVSGIWNLNPIHSCRGNLANKVNGVLIVLERDGPWINWEQRGGQVALSTQFIVAVRMPLIRVTAITGM